MAVLWPRPPTSSAFEGSGVRKRCDLSCRGMWSLPKALADALKQNSSLTTINLSWNDIGADGAKAAVLLRPSLAFMWPACSACQALAEALKQNSSLTTIDLRGNKIGADGAKAAVLSRPSNAFMWPSCPARQALAEALKQNSSFTTIDLSENGIG